MTIYELPNTTTISGLALWANTTTTGVFGWIVFICLWCVCFIATFKKHEEASLIFASFMTLIASILFAAAGITGGTPILAFGIVFAVSMAIQAISNS